MEASETSSYLLEGGPSRADAQQQQQQQQPARSFLPAFADEANRALDAEIRAMEAELGRTQAALEENEGHARVLADHLDSVRLEIRHTQARLGARTKEAASEAHARELAAREAGRLRADGAALQQRRGELAQRVAGLQTEAFQAGERLDQFRLLQSWNQEELEQWAVAAAQKEQDRLALERYSRQDEAKIKELGLGLERAAREAQQAKRDLEEEATATQAARGELAKAAADFRRLAAERAELLAQWEGVLEAISKRDAAILEAGALGSGNSGQEVAERRARLAVLRQELAAQVAELDAEVAAGAAAAKRIAARERRIKAHYNAYSAGQAAAAEAEDALDLISNSAGRAADEAQAAAAAAGHLRAELARRQAGVEAAQARLEAARVRLALEGQQLGSLQQKVQELEGLRGEEARRGEALERELAALAKQQFRAGQALHAAQEEERRLGSELGGARAQGRNLSQRIAQLEEQLVLQQEVRYAADYQLVQQQARVARAEGRRSRDETATLTARIQGLEAQLEAARAEQGQLAEAVKRAEDDYARAQRQSLAVQRERAALADDMARLEVEAGAVARAVKAASKEREGRLVEVDLLKLEVQRLRAALGSQSGEVEGLEARRRGLEAGMRERRSEVEVQLELMQGEARLLRDEVHRLGAELQQRQLALSKLRAKHEALALKRRAEDGGEAHSQAYYVVKAAQQKQELVDEAEALRGRIAQAERECRALEATLGRLTGSNSDWHWAARHAGAQELVQEQAGLRAQLEAAQAALQAAQAAEAARAGELEQLKERLRNAVAEEAGMRQRVEALQRQKADAQAQLAEQAERQQRAAARAARLRKQAEAKGPSGCGLPPGVGLEALAADVQLAQVREATRGMVEALRGVAAEHPELNLVQRVEAEAGVKLPAGQETVSRPGSAAAAARLCSGGSASGRSSPCSRRPGAGAAAPAAARSPARSRPGSCAGSVRSSASSVAARGSPAAKSPAVQTMTLQL